MPAGLAAAAGTALKKEGRDQKSDCRGQSKKWAKPRTEEEAQKQQIFRYERALPEISSPGRSGKSMGFDRNLRERVV
jgi:hypothetical protein